MRRFFGGGTKFKQSDVVKLREGAPFEHLQTGQVGVVIKVRKGDDTSYEVEFLDSRGGVLDRVFVKEVYLSEVE